MDKPDKIIELEALFGNEFYHFEINFESGLQYYSKPSSCCYSTKDNTIIAFEINFEIYCDWDEDADLASSKYKYQKILSDFINSISNLETLEFIKITGDKQRLGFDINRLNIFNNLKLISLSFLDIGSDIILNEFSSLKFLALRFCLIKSIEFEEQNFSTFKHLDLSNNQICDIASFSNFQKLNYLNLQSNKIEDISSLYLLNTLRELRFDNNRVKHIDPKAIYSWCSINLLCTTNNPVENIPPEIINDQNGSMSGIRSFLSDELNSGSEKNNEVKILIFGNGNVGKSQIAHRLSDFPFNPEYNSTQKIDLFLTSLSTENNENPLNLNIWDFGGQDIYHVTHRVFMETSALFVIVWDHISEFESHHSWNGNDYENYSLNYWIEYVNYHSPCTPILVVQNKIDFLEEGGTLIIPASKSEIKVKYGYKIDFAEVCARPIDDQTINKSLSDDGIEILKMKILNIFRNNSNNEESGLAYNFSDPSLAEFKRSINTKWPNSWKEVVKEIREKQKNKVREITKKEFFDLCTEIEKNNNFKISNQSELLRFLSNASILYYNENYLADTVIIDQEWFIEEMYKLFDRTKPYYNQLSGKIDDTQTALLTPTLINKIWPDTSKEEISTYLNYLIKAEIILKLGSKGKHDWFDINNDTFFVPAYLPSTTPSLENYKSVHKITNEKILEFGFIPPVLIKRLMLNYMSYSKSVRIKDKWQKGLFIAYENQLCIVTVEYLIPKLKIEYNDNSVWLKNKILEEIELINSGSFVKFHETKEAIVYGLKSLDFDKKSNPGKVLTKIENIYSSLNNSEYHLTPDLIQDLVINLGSSDKILEAREIFVNGSSNNFERLINLLQSFVYEYRDTNINLNKVIMALENKKTEITVTNSGQGNTTIIGEKISTASGRGSSANSGDNSPIFDRNKNGFFFWLKQFKWIILSIPLIAGGTWFFWPESSLLGNVIFKGINKELISKISIDGHPELGSQVLSENGDFKFRGFPKTEKLISFLIRFNKDHVEKTENFVVRQVENNILTVDNIWVENEYEFIERNKKKTNAPKFVKVVNNKNTIYISQSNANGDNVIDSTSIKIEK